MASSLETPIRTEKTDGGTILGLVLRVKGTEHDGKRVFLRATKCSIGASPSCTLRLIADGIGPVHCFIVRGDQGVVIRSWAPDTRLNGCEFQDEWFRPGDVLQVGPVELEFIADRLSADCLPAKRQEDARPMADPSATQHDTARCHEVRRVYRERVRKIGRQLRQANRRLRDLETVVQSQADFESRRQRLDEQFQQCLEMQERLQRQQEELEQRESQQLLLPSNPSAYGEHRTAQPDGHQDREEFERERTLWSQQRSEFESELQAERERLQFAWEELSCESGPSDAQLQLERQVAELTANQDELLHKCEHLVTTLVERQGEVEELKQILAAERQMFRERHEELATRQAERRVTQGNELTPSADSTDDPRAAESPFYADDDEPYEGGGYSTVDHEPEEIRFSEPDSSAPTDAASVLAKYGVAFPQDDDEPSQHDAQSPDGAAHQMGLEPSGDEHRQYQEEAEAKAADADEPSKRATAPDSSIDDYMADLMQRVASGPICSVPAKVLETLDPHPPAQTPEIAVDAGNSFADEEQTDNESLLKPEDFVPRTKRPQFDLSAMRDVANETARVAIDRHESRRSMQITFANWALAGISLLIGLGLAALIRAPLSPASIGTVIALTATFNWGYRGVQAYRDVLHHRRVEASIRASLDD